MHNCSSNHEIFSVINIKLLLQATQYKKAAQIAGKKKQGMNPFYFYFLYLWSTEIFL